MSRFSKYFKFLFFLLSFLYITCVQNQNFNLTSINKNNKKLFEETNNINLFSNFTYKKNKFQQFQQIHTFPNNFSLTKINYSTIYSEISKIIKLHNKNKTGIRFLQNTKTQEIYFDQVYGYALNIQCNPKTNCLPPNYCFNNFTACNCSILYANFFDPEYLITTNQTIFCSYERKKQLTSFLLAVFFNIGIAQFYIQSVHLGLIKLAIALISVILIPFAVCYKNPLFSMMVGLFFCFIISIWGLIDIILFGINYYDDGFGVPLSPW